MDLMSKPVRHNVTPMCRADNEVMCLRRAYTGVSDNAATTSRPDHLPGSVDAPGCGSMDLLLFMIYCYDLLLLLTQK